MVQDYEDDNDYDDDEDHDSNNTKRSVSERIVFDILNNVNLGRYSH